MKQTILKLLSLTLYVGMLLSLLAESGWSGGMTLWVARLVFGYCSLIVLAHLLSTLIGWSRCLLAISREHRELAVCAQAVAFETETEAT